MRAVTSFFKVYIEATDGGVEDSSFWDEMEEMGIDRSSIVASYACADQDGYSVTVKVRGKLPKGVESCRGSGFNKMLVSEGQWPEL